MIKNTSLSAYLWYMGLCFLFTTRSAQAYLDPGMGSYLLQIVVGTILGLSLTIKVYWHRLKAFFYNGEDDTPDSGEACKGDG